VTNKFYVPGGERAGKVQDLFGTIAARYDLINDLQSFGLHRLWKRRVVSMAGGNPGQTVLDLCCGTGDIALAFAKKGMDTVGLDFSPAMLAVAEKRAKRLHLISNSVTYSIQQEEDHRKPNAIEERKKVPLLPGGEGRDEGVRSSQTGMLRFMQGDALHLPFPDDSFDIVTIGYGLRNLADFDGGLREIRRVTRKGGRVLVLDFGKPDNAVIRGLYFFYLRRCVPLLGKLFCGDFHTHAYILESLLNYPAQRGVDARLRELGFVETRIVNLLCGAMSINYAVKA
jgi:demethylmenaquinone methyltransferase/2-methoxy-6-polyprenyl-1,4-benzoquinol methylase